MALPDSDDMDDDEPEGVVNTVYVAQLGGTTPRKAPQCQVHVNHQPMKALIDTGASINLMAQELFHTIPDKPSLRQTKVLVYAFGNDSPLPLAGMFMANITHEKQTTKTKVYVTTAGSGVLISCKTVEELKLIHFTFRVHLTSLEDTLEQYPSIFSGIGCLKHKEVRLHIDQSIQPVALRHRRVVFHLRPKVEAELRKLEEAGIIEKVEGPTPWMSPIVVTRKPKQPGEVHLCVDMWLPIWPSKGNDT